MKISVSTLVALYSGVAAASSWRRELTTEDFANRVLEGFTFTQDIDSDNILLPDSITCSDFGVSTLAFSAEGLSPGEAGELSVNGNVDISATCAGFNFNADIKIPLSAGFASFGQTIPSLLSFSNVDCEVNPTQLFDLTVDADIIGPLFELFLEPIACNAVQSVLAQVIQAYDVSNFTFLTNIGPEIQDIVVTALALEQQLPLEDGHELLISPQTFALLETLQTEILLTPLVRNLVLESTEIAEALAQGDIQGAAEGIEGILFLITGEEIELPVDMILSLLSNPIVITTVESIISLLADGSIEQVVAEILQDLLGDLLPEEFYVQLAENGFDAAIDFLLESFKVSDLIVGLPELQTLLEPFLQPILEGNPDASILEVIQELSLTTANEAAANLPVENPFKAQLENLPPDVPLLDGLLGIFVESEFQELAFLFPADSTLGELVSSLPGAASIQDVLLILDGDILTGLEPFLEGLTVSDILFLLPVDEAVGQFLESLDISPDTSLFDAILRFSQITVGELVVLIPDQEIVAMILQFLDEDAKVLNLLADLFGIFGGALDQGPPSSGDIDVAFNFNSSEPLPELVLTLLPFVAELVPEAAEFIALVLTEGNLDPLFELAVFSFPIEGFGAVSAGLASTSFSIFFSLEVDKMEIAGSSLITPLIKLEADIQIGVDLSFVNVEGDNLLDESFIVNTSLGGIHQFALPFTFNVDAVGEIDFSEVDTLFDVVQVLTLTSICLSDNVAFTLSAVRSESVFVDIDLEVAADSDLKDFVVDLFAEGFIIAAGALPAFSSNMAEVVNNEFFRLEPSGGSCDLVVQGDSIDDDDDDDNAGSGFPVAIAVPIIVVVLLVLLGVVVYSNFSRKKPQPEAVVDEKKAANPVADEVDNVDVKLGVQEAGASKTVADVKAQEA